MSRGNKTVVFTLCHSFVNGKRWILLKLKLPEEYHTTKILPKHCAYVVHIEKAQGDDGNLRAIKNFVYDLFKPW